MPTAWERLLDDVVARRVRPSWRDDEPRIVDWVRRFEFRAKNKAVLVTMKDWTVERLASSQGKLPTYAGVLVRTRIPTGEFTLALDRMLRPWKVPLVYVGDLDPHDLACFRAFQLGDPRLRTPRRVRYRITYVGIDSEWLRRCTASFRKDHTIEHVTLPLSRFERREWEALQATWPGVRRLIGAEATALLDSGRKLEIEGATNPWFFRPGHIRWARERVRAALT